MHGLAADDRRPRRRRHRHGPGVRARSRSCRAKLELENEYLREEVTRAGAFGELVGQGPALEAVARQIDLVAPTDSAVLILGESGTGKELVAREIHRRSKRAGRPLIKVNCAAVPRELYESEFFGHARGAFTGALRDRAGRFELADGGTLFLDEVGEIPLELQAKLLRVLQEGELERVGEERTRKVNVRLDRGHQPRPPRRGRGRAVPAGPVLPAQRVPGRAAAAAQADGRHPAAGRALPGPGRPQARAAEAAADAGERPAASAIPLARERPGAAARDRAGGHHRRRRPPGDRAAGRSRRAAGQADGLARPEPPTGC